MATKKKIEKLSDLIPDGNNYNRGTDFGGELIEKSFRRLGAGRSVLADKHGNLMAGNKAGKGFLAAGFKDEDIIVVPTDGTKLVVVQRMDLDLKTKRGKEMALADNATSAANLAWDMEALAADEWDKDELAAWGVSDWSEDAEHEGDNTKGHAQEDDFEVPEIETVTTDIQIGDLFEIGRHRLLCGDSTVAENVARLMNGEQAGFVFTDPPYGVGYKYDSHDDTGGSGYSDLIKAVWRTLKDFDCPVVLTPGNTNLWLWLSTGDFRLACWVKKNAMSPSSIAHLNIFEIILLYGVKQRRNTDLLEYSVKQQEGVGNHTCPKLLEMVGDCIGSWAGDAKTLYDPFLGSGTTMVAAHQLNRTCYGIELSPQYCQVIIQRMLKLDPALPVKRNGIDETDKWLLNAE